MAEVNLGTDTAVLTVAGGVGTLRPTVRDWHFDVSGADHVRLNGSLPPELIGSFQLLSNDGVMLRFGIADRSLQSGRPVGCQVTFLRNA
jgi:hypothetical protein